MTGSIVLAVLGLFLWIFGIICCIGLDTCLISGYWWKKERAKFKKEYDCIAMNRYLSRTMFFPLAGIITVCAVLLYFKFPFSRTTAFGVIITVAIFAVVGLCFYSATQILGDRFKR